MSNNTIRINTTPNGADRFVKVKLDQEFDFIEILSLKISQTDAYRNFCADYGVVAGRVVVNNSFGVPNAKVSIFIPIDDIDSLDPEILGLYPYEIVSDKNSDGVRYNLLPTTSDSANQCFTPIGTFPAKREILDNPVVMEIYNKYYKFTTTTNFAGDYMIFGVPIGTYTIHVDADISDIGIISQRPYDSISQGSNPKLFDSSTKFKGGTNLDKLVQVKTANAAVNIEPFWGNSDNCEIGINRIDLDLNYTVVPAAIFMGNIFGDTDKNSINKNCIPRRNLGTLCDQSTGEGTVEMIRETVDGKIQKFDIEGARLIDNNGAWAYQIPMNLDYVITNENGDLVPSDDPNKGIPTRANVRFRVAMDQTGGEGRLRTRAKYLVPHNPNIQAEIDYEFGEKTKKSSLRNIYWNKIYSVSNFISRYQQENILAGGLATRSTTGVKNVDGCGDKTPFPFNRVNTTFNPIFFIICLIIQILAVLIFVINYLMIPLINLVIAGVNGLIGAWNSLMKPLCSRSGKKILGVKVFGFLGFTCNLILDEIDYLACVYVKCPFEDNSEYYAPGCKNNSREWKKANNEVGLGHWYDDKDGHKGFFNLAGLDQCVAFEMAKVLGLFEFDFYNDWVNGSLYAFLLKYKRKRRGREKFCEYDCSNFGIAAGGVDGDKNGDPDNRCHNNNIVDSCFKSSDGSTGKNSHKELRHRSIKEGVVKKYKDELYYAASTHNASYKLFATEIVNLGSVFDCDWQNIPKLQQYLVPTTYNIPPVGREVDEDNLTIVLTTGQCSIGGNSQGLFFDIDCLGLHVNYRQCLNIRHLCEFGVELDEYRENPPSQPTLADGIIGINDLDLDDADRPKWFRDIFTGLNITGGTLDLKGLPFSTNFNNHNQGDYDFTASGATEMIDGRINGYISGDKYIAFRGYPLDNALSLTQPKHSYYFYFGLLPAKTALDKMNQNFFAPCPARQTLLFDVNIETTSPNFTDPKSGAVKITFLNGTGPYNGTVSGPAGYTLKFVVGENNTPPVYNLTGIVAGTYTITGTDSKNTVVNETFVITPPPSIYGDAVVTSDSTNEQIPNGKILITSVGGGSTDSKGTHSYKLYNSKGDLVSKNDAFTTIPLEISNLAADSGPNHTFDTILGITKNDNPVRGYILQLSDSAGNSIYITNLVVQGASPIVVTVLEPLQIACFGERGSINLDIQGGKTPYDIQATGEKTGLQFSGKIMNNVPADKYTIRVEDVLGTVSIISHELKSVGKEMVILSAVEDEEAFIPQCFSDKYNIGITLSGQMKTGDKFTILFSGENPEEGERVFTEKTTVEFETFTKIINLTFTKAEVVDGVALKLRDANNCFSPELVFDISEIELPPVSLSINVNGNGINNTKQCVPNQVSFNFNISHLEKTYPDFTPRTPYTAFYTVTGTNGSGSKTNSQQSKEITSNQQVIQANVVTPNGQPATKCSISVFVKDNTGCQSLPLTINVNNLPTVKLAANWTKSTTTAGGTKYHYTFNVVGGVLPYSKGIPTDNGGVETTTSPTEVFTSTIADNVGCPVTKASNQ